MRVCKFCQCGVKLERDVADEDVARKVVDMFRREHSGAGHGPIIRSEYDKLIRKLIKKFAEGKSVVVSEMEAMERKEINDVLDRLEKDL